MFTMMEKVAPGLNDRMKMPHFEGQHSGRPPQDEDTLFAPRPGDGRVHGKYPGHVMQSSAYTAMAKRPGMTALGMAALGVGIAVAARSLMAERGDWAERRRHAGVRGTGAGRMGASRPSARSTPFR